MIIAGQGLKQVDQQRGITNITTQFCKTDSDNVFISVCERPPPTYENILTNPPVDFKTNLKVCEYIHTCFNK